MKKETSNPLQPLRTFLSGFRSMVLAVGVLCLVNIIVYIILSIQPNLNLFNSMRLSSSQPWGIITAIFTHVQPAHIIINLVSFIFVSAFFIIFSQEESNTLRSRLGKGFVRIGLGAGIGAFFAEYLIQLVSPRDPSCGFSGVGYATLGILMAKLVLNLPSNYEDILYAIRNRKKIKKQSFQMQTLILTIGSTLVLAILLVSIVVDPSGFLSVAPHVDSLAHGIGFLIGFWGFWLIFRRDFIGKRNR